MTAYPSKRMEGVSSIVFALWYLAVDRVEELLNEHPEWLDHKYHYGETALHMLAIGNMPTNMFFTDHPLEYVALGELYLSHGADPSIVDGFGLTVGEAAVRYKSWWLLSLLRAHGKLEESLRGESDCPICMESFDSILGLGMNLWAYDCKHVICKMCRMRIVNNICPVCCKEERVRNAQSYFPDKPMP